jgi:segregation and condensation protein B
LASRRDLPGLSDLKAAGLLDPVDLALEGLQGLSAVESGDMPEEGESELEIGEESA